MKKIVLIIAVVSGLACFFFLFWNSQEEDVQEGVMIERMVPKNGVVSSVSALEGTKWSRDNFGEGATEWIEFYKNKVFEHTVTKNSLLEERFGSSIVKRNYEYQYYLSSKKVTKFDHHLVGRNTVGNYLTMEDLNDNLKTYELYWMTPKKLCFITTSEDTLIYSRLPDNYCSDTEESLNLQDSVVSIALLISTAWELASPDYSSYRHTILQFYLKEMKETIIYKKDKKTLSASHNYYLADTITEYFDDQQVGKMSKGRYIIQKRYDGKAVCKEVVSASANEIKLKNRLGAILVWKKKKEN